MSRPYRSSKASAIARRWFAGWVAGWLFLNLTAAAAEAERWLVIFDTSAAMKQRLPAVEAAVKNLYTNTFPSRLHAGDSVGVWTLGQQLHTGEFPLLTWPPENPSTTAANLTAFVRQQSYGGNTHFDALQPALTRIIADSERLTIIVFCDGQEEIKWTPYAAGINATFQKNLAERKTTARPFALLLRTQRGTFTDCTVSFPPGALKIPPFPPLPEETGTAPTNPPPPPALPQRPPPTVPGLIIVGTKVGTNLVDLHKTPPATNPLAIAWTNPVPPVSNPPPVIPTIPPSPASPKTSASVIVVPPPSNHALTETSLPVANLTNAPATAAPTDRSSSQLLLIGGSALGLAVMLGILLAVRSRRTPRGSLITDSMNAPKVPPRKK